MQLIWDAPLFFYGLILAGKDLLISENTTVDKKDNVIIIVPGWGTSITFNNNIKKFLEDSGFTVYLFNHNLNLGDLKIVSNKLKMFIDKNNLKNFNLIGISIGSPVCYYYLQKLGGWKKANKFISIAGSLRGSHYAYLAFISKSARQMIPGSRYLKSLHKGSPKQTKNILLINAKKDEIVSKKSNNIAGAKIFNSITSGHLYIQFFKNEAFREIMFFLKDHKQT